jgi:hypothetical protein
MSGVRSEWLLTKNAAAAAAAAEEEAAALEEAEFVGPQPLLAEQRAQGGHGYGGALRPGALPLLLHMLFGLMAS